MEDSFVEVWHGDTFTEGDELQNYWNMLNKQEQKKAMTFVRPELQNKYIKTRGVLRKVLSSYLNMEPCLVQINIGEYGKPYLDEDLLYFNLSHSKNKFVIAVSNCTELGIDVEETRKRNNLFGLVEKCFSESEQLHWGSLSKQQQLVMFYRYWVRKEAFVKAVGRGIALGLDQCVLNDDLNSFSKIPDCHGRASDWKIVDIPIDENIFCVLVCKAIEYQYKQVSFR